MERLRLPSNLPSPIGMKKVEILELLLREEYGFLPPEPKRLDVQEESCKEFCAGKAFLKKLRFNCESENGSFSFPVYFTLPKKTDKKAPCFIHINFRDMVPDRYMPSEEIVDGGYAVLSFCYKDVATDDGDFSRKLPGVVYQGERKPEQCGKIGLWAWAAIRVMDYAVTVPELDSTRICVAGHSRLGKTALLAGALDERFYCAFSNDSGCSGAALSREKKGETIEKICATFPYWFCENYAKYAGREEMLPFDQHFLLAANMPHKVYVASAIEDEWACPQNEYYACVAASVYYKEHGMVGLVHPDRLPVVGDYFGEGDIGYHLRAGSHYFSREDWQFFMRYISQGMN